MIKLQPLLISILKQVVRDTLKYSGLIAHPDKLLNYIQQVVDGELNFELVLFAMGIISQKCSLKLLVM